MNTFLETYGSEFVVKKEDYNFYQDPVRAAIASRGHFKAPNGIHKFDVAVVDNALKIVAMSPSHANGKSFPLDAKAAAMEWLELGLLKDIERQMASLGADVFVEFEGV